MMTSRLLRSVALGTSLLIAPAVHAQDAGTGEPVAASDEIAISPSRLELELGPGQEKTVVINVVYSSQNASTSKPSRLLASLGDWTLSDSGQVQFKKPGEQKHSASKWVLYSPVEFTAQPGKTSQIRVTVSVPKDTQPGDYTSVLFVEERPGSLKTRSNKKELSFHFRLSTILYVQVPPLSRKGSLKNLTATANAKGVTLTPTIMNEGNAHIRPMQSVKILDAKEKVVVDYTQPEGFPVLRESTTSQPLVLSDPLPPGEYQVRYRVNMNDGSAAKEGRTKLTVTEGAMAADVDGGTPAPRTTANDAGVAGKPDAGKR